MKTVMTIAHKLVRANRFFGVAKYRELFAVALKQAWAQVRNVVVAISADDVKSFADNAGCAAFAYIANPKFIEVTIRGKKTDKVYVNLDARKVSFKGLGASLANKIATQFNLSIAY